MQCHKSEKFTDLLKMAQDFKYLDMDTVFHKKQPPKTYLRDQKIAQMQIFVNFYVLAL